MRRTIFSLTSLLVPAASLNAAVKVELTMMAHEGMAHMEPPPKYQTPRSF